MTENVKKILEIIENAGHEAYIVGGCVRDYFLKKIPKDYDVTTSMEPHDVMELFRKAGYNVVPTGLKHGTVTVFPIGETEGYEITTYRTDGEYLDSRHPSSVSFTKNLTVALSPSFFNVKNGTCLSSLFLLPDSYFFKISFKFTYISPFLYLYML